MHGNVECNSTRRWKSSSRRVATCRVASVVLGPPELYLRSAFPCAFTVISLGFCSAASTPARKRMGSIALKADACSHIFCNLPRANEFGRVTPVKKEGRKKERMEGWMREREREEIKSDRARARETFFIERKAENRGKLSSSFASRFLSASVASFQSTQRTRIIIRAKYSCPPEKSFYTGYRV